MNNTPMPRDIVDKAKNSLHLANFAKANIREIVSVANKVEADTGLKYVRMEMGVPGLPPDAIGTAAEIQALQNGCAARYPMLDGLPALKNAAAHFVKAFTNATVEPRCCIPVCGSMQGAYATFMTISHATPQRDTVLFIDPGFPVQKTQLDIIGLKHAAFDIHHTRGSALLAKVEEFLKQGNIAAMLFANPNNPSWTCLTDNEIQGIAALADKYDTLIVEDLAYFGMDFRKDISHPGTPPFQPSVAKYTDRFVMLISGSKAFSYAGQRIGVAIMSSAQFDRQYQDLAARYGVPNFGSVFVNRILYCLSSGTAHSAQYALAAMLSAAANGKYNFLDAAHEYGRRAEAIKNIFLNNGFHLVYADDMGEPLANGFYFTVGYHNMPGAQLMEELLYYGISIISLDTTGSHEQGLRVCVSFVNPEQYDTLNQRLQQFNKDHHTNI